MKTPNLSTVFEQNSGLTALISKAKRLLEINHYFREILADPNLSQHCNIANSHQGTLIIFIDSAAWRLKLQFLQQQLLSQLQEKYPEIKKLEFRLNPINLPQEKPKTPPTISEKSRELVREAANHIADERLKNALLRLVN